MKYAAEAVCVDPACVSEFWPHVKPLLEAAFRRVGEGDADATLADLKTGAALLWLAWDGMTIVGAATTTLLKNSSGLVCFITSCGGRDLPRWRHCLDAIERYARDEGCAAIRFQGRRGWQAIFPEYQQPWVMLEKRLDT